VRPSPTLGSHGRPHVIDISAQHVENHLSVQVSDDGIGFDVEAASTLSHDHYGILGMHERAEMIGACLKITSKITIPFLGHLNGSRPEFSMSLRLHLRTKAVPQHE